MSVVERMYDGQMCLAEFGIPPILFGKFCLMLQHCCLNNEPPILSGKVTYYGV